MEVDDGARPKDQGNNIPSPKPESSGKVWHIEFPFLTLPHSLT